MSLPRNPFAELPDKVYETMCSALNMEFATMTAQGVPLDTPTLWDRQSERTEFRLRDRPRVSVEGRAGAPQSQSRSTV